MIKFARYFMGKFLAIFKQKCNLFFTAICLFISCIGYTQSKSESYLYHFNPFNPQLSSEGPRVRMTKVKIDFGIVSQFYSYSLPYTVNSEGDGAYTLGVKLEIPVLANDDIITGFDFVRESFDFDSWYFAPGQSFFYDSNKIYNHNIDMDELQIPILYKFNFASETRNVKIFYLTLGWAFRYIFYDNALIQNIKSGDFVWEGQNDIQSVFQLISPQCSGMLEAALGYQHNTLRNGNAWFFEITYKYGFSPLVYLGNNNGSNDIQFTLNSLSFILGWKF